MAKKAGQDVSAASLAAEANVDEVIVGECSLSLFWEVEPRLIDLERLMRMICWMGYCDEVGENIFRASATTMHVCTTAMLGGEKHQWVDLERNTLFTPLTKLQHRYPLRYRWQSGRDDAGSTRFLFESA